VRGLVHAACPALKKNEPMSDAPTKSTPSRQSSARETPPSVPRKRPPTSVRVGKKKQNPTILRRIPAPKNRPARIPESATRAPVDRTLELIEEIQNEIGEINELTSLIESALKHTIGFCGGFRPSKIHLRALRRARQWNRKRNDDPVQI